MIATAWTLARKDLRLFFRDRTALALSLALPLLLATVFGTAMAGMAGGGGGGSGGPKPIRLLVEDLDGTPESAALTKALDDSQGLASEAATNVERAVRNGDVAAAVVIPRGYGGELAAGRIPRFRLLLDPGAQLTQQLARVHVSVAAGGTLMKGLGDRVMGRALDLIDFPGIGRDTAQAILDRSFADMESLVERLESEGAFDEPGEEHEAATADGETGGFDFMTDLPELMGIDAEAVAGTRDGELAPSAGSSHAIASMAVMMLMFSVAGAGGTLLEERQTGTLGRLLLAPGAGSAVLLGKLLSISLISLLQLALLFGYGATAFDVPVLEHPVALGVTALVQIYATVGMGLFFGTVCRSQKQLEGLSTLIILVMSAVGGAWFPREITPDWFQTAGLFTVTAWAMDAYHGVLWYGKGLVAEGDLDGIWPQLAVLAGIGVALHATAIRLFRRRFLLKP